MSSPLHPIVDEEERHRPDRRPGQTVDRAFTRPPPPLPSHPPLTPLATGDTHRCYPFYLTQRRRDEHVPKSPRDGNDGHRVVVVIIIIVVIVFVVLLLLLVMGAVAPPPDLSRRRRRCCLLPSLPTPPPDNRSQNRPKLTSNEYGDLRWGVAKVTTYLRTPRVQGRRTGTDLATSPPTKWATAVTPVVDVTFHASFFFGGGGCGQVGSRPAPLNSGRSEVHGHPRHPPP